MDNNFSAPWNIQQQKNATAEDIFYCFRLILGRAPNQEEWKGHVAQAGANINSVVGSYVNSLEFSRRLTTFLHAQPDSRITLKDLKDFSIYVQDTDSAVGQHIKNSGEYEPHVTTVFRDRLKAGMHVLDIGANIGYFSMLSASLVKATGSVMAIEPNPNNAKLLEASRRANAFDNVLIVQAAAGREAGLLVLNTSHSNGTTAVLSSDLRSLIDSTTVPCFKIDDIVSKDKQIDFVKIDVEGAEYNALFGTSDIISRCHPTIVSEFSPDLMPGISGVNGPQYLEFLLNFGYKISVIELDDRLTDCGNDVAKVMAAYTHSGVDHIDLLMT